ncbi:MAG TPA: RNA polymerase subunit sigma-24 [Prevotellaceae bacterium]|nr:RNA polymerase subunit sigma-24 [Prevotellaceae bacterium]
MNRLDAMTDHELAGLYEQGNDNAFDELLRRHQDYVYSYILFVCKNEDTAQDLFQDTFARAVMAIRNHKYQKTGKFSAWLVRIAHNLAIDRMRDTAPTLTITHEEFPHGMSNSMRFSEGTVENRIIESQDTENLRALLDYLPDVQREVVIMKFYEDLPFKEIAEKTGVSINTSLGRMRYALINLRKLIRKHQMSLVG